LIADFQEDERRIGRELEMRMDAELEYIDEGLTLLGVAKGAKRLFEGEDLYVKKQVLTTLLSNSIYRNRTLTATYRKPFDIIVKKLPQAALAREPEGGFSPKSRKWLPE